MWVPSLVSKKMLPCLKLDCLPLEKLQITQVVLK